MSKRPLLDLSSLTSEAAIPMAEAVQRTAAAPAAPEPVTKEPIAAPKREANRAPKQDTTAVDEAKTINLEPLNFKVPAGFRKRFRQCAFDANLKLNELLFASLDAWEKQNSQKH